VGVIVDCHHHIWPHSELPWLAGPMIPRIFGPYAPLQGRDYTAQEYAADATANGIQRSVYVQANWPLERSVDEVRWVQAAHEQTGWPHAIVGSADLFSGDAGDVFAAQAAASPLMRGIRLQLHWHADERFRFASAPDRMKDPVLRRNLERLADLGWVFELQVFSGQMEDAAELVGALPDVTFVLVHAGMLEGSEPAVLARWRAGMERLAQLPNLVVKLTGQGTFVHRVDRDLIAQVTDETLGWFGAERCMWGTNFPIESLWTDLGTLVRTWREVLAAYPDAVQAAVLGQNAERVYRL
jgi:predicted TIM-barrel fold metal-dependent hydrolase